MLSRPVLADVLAKIAGRRVLVVGDICLDSWIVGTVERMSQEAPVPVLRRADRRASVGMAGNVVANLISLGGEAGLIGLVGDDDCAGEVETLLTALMRGSGRDWRHTLLVDHKRPTTVKERFLSPQQMLRVDHESRDRIDDDTERAAILAVERVITDRLKTPIDAIVIQDHGKGFVTHKFCRNIIDLAQRFTPPIPVLVDPTPANAAAYKGASILMPNRLEAKLMTGIDASDSDEALDACVALKKNTGVSTIVLKRGADGMSVLDERNEFRSVPTVALKVFDVCGAGDTAVAALALAIAAGIDVITGVQLANAAAAVSVAKPGTAVVSPEEILI